MTQDQPSDQPIVVDARGLNCPLPVLRLRKRLKDVAVGALVELLATDRAALRDVPAFCAGRGHDVAPVVEERDGTLRFRVRKSGSAA